MEDSEKATEHLLKICLQQQMDELDMLQSIFCNSGELKIEDHSILADINEFLEDKQAQLNQKLYYNITITLIETQKLDIQFELPHSYPLIEPPIITIRSKIVCNNKSLIENEIKRQIMEFIDTIDKSSVYVYQVIVWLQENYERIFKENTEYENVTITDPITKQKKTLTDDLVELERLWIYSHHLKSMTKRQDIMKLAKELNLSGFSKPGKPGIICVEGYKENTQEFWKCIRQWAWQRITVRLNESKTKPMATNEKFRKFDQFKEILSVDEMEYGNRPIDMSAFMKFLDSHNCTYVKKELFNF